MADCFDNLPRWARDKLETPQGHKDWMQCRSRHVYKDVAILKKCGGCSAYRIAPIYYCVSIQIFILSQLTLAVEQGMPEEV